ncbi:MAG: M23 family metallopeptidase [Candidatus Aminicenantes bacterium]|nr:M23 family metallopeptidase [Candidatus Aminicenantes bacterium]
MSKRSFSLIIIPHSRAGSKSLSVSKKAVKIALGAAGFLFALFVFLGIDYLSMNHVRSHYRRLKRESEIQKATLEKYKIDLDQLKKTVYAFETYAKKLNIMAGLKAPGVSEVGIGDNASASMLQALTPAPQSFSLSNIQQLNQKAVVLEKNLDTLVNFYENQSARLASTPTIWPTVGWVTSGFGSRIDPFTGKPAFHYGMDIATNIGSPIYATADGTVIHVKTDKMGGKVLIISHGNNVSTHYLHLDKFLVKEGQKVRRGDVIGLVGRTGKALGPHLHYEVRINGVAQNPYLYILEE